MCFCPGTLGGPEARDCIFLRENVIIISEGGFYFISFCFEKTFVQRLSFVNAY